MGTLSEIYILCPLVHAGKGLCSETVYHWYWVSEFFFYKQLKPIQKGIKLYQLEVELQKIQPCLLQNIWETIPSFSLLGRCFLFLMLLVCYQQYSFPSDSYLLIPIIQLALGFPSLEHQANNIHDHSISYSTTNLFKFFLEKHIIHFTYS